MFDGFSRIDFQSIYPGFLEAGKIYLLKVITSGRFSKINGSKNLPRRGSEIM